MSQKTIILVVALFVVIVLGMFVFALMKNSEIKEEQLSDPVVEEENEPYSDITRVTATHFFIDGVHTLVGEIPMPTPCDLLEAESEISTAESTEVLIRFSVINNADFCAQVVTPQRFMVTREAEEDVTFSATFNGRDIELNIIEAEEGDTPEDFELFIKG